MNYEKFFQKLKVEVDDQKMPMHKLFIAGFVRNSESVIDTIVIVCDEKTSCYEFYIFVYVKLICTSVNKAIY
jgi:hypothetical protein